jgi:hypothetical protein
LVVVVLLGALAFVAGRPRRPDSKEKKSTLAPRERAAIQGQSAKAGKPRARNLSLQPEASEMGRRLGKRFSPDKLERSILVGTLTIGSELKIVQTTRTQSDDGEQVEIKIAGLPGALTWDRNQGTLLSGSRATGSDRQLVERLVLDSPDQFVLAQLRGASYYTVARNVRPVDASDKYSGPLWNIIRIGDPESDEAKRPESRWRLYYVNAVTGLIDRIESEAQGQRIVAEISWTDLDGEKIPTQIIWTSQGQTLMQYRLTNFSHSEK